MALKCIPLNPAWTGDTKLDLRAIYKRPNGDLTGSLPMRRHHSWEAKGLAYVTLADAESFVLAIPFLRSLGLNPNDFVAGIDGDGRPTPWMAEAYLADEKANQVTADAKLAAMVAEFGVEAVEKITGKPVPDALRAEVTVKTRRDKVPA
jgi:hypothetical protein